MKESMKYSVANLSVDASILPPSLTCSLNVGMRKALAIALAALVIGLLAVTVGLLSSRGKPSISVHFSRYAFYDLGRGYTNRPAAHFVISNSGPRSVVCSGRGEWERGQLVQILRGETWVETHDWDSPSGGNIALSPSQSREVMVWVQTNLPWRVGFQFRELGFADHCPMNVLRIIPERLRRQPPYRVVWTDPVPPYDKR